MKKIEEMEVKNDLIEAVKTKKTFAELGVNDQLVKSVTELGYTHATEIQERSIPVLISGTKDFIGLAQTGTGKTAAFALPLLNKIDSSNRDVQAIILTPTRELANQINDEIKKFSTYERIKTLPVYGGVSIRAISRYLSIAAIRWLRSVVKSCSPGVLLTLPSLLGKTISFQ